MALINNDQQIFEDDGTGNLHELEEINDLEQLNTDGDDRGPAPLQNTNASLETFEGVMNVGERNTALGANATMAVNELEDAVLQMHSRRLREPWRSRPPPTWRFLWQAKWLPDCAYTASARMATPIRAQKGS